MGLGLVFGIVIGAILSAITGNAVWIALGVSFGIVLALPSPYGARPTQPMTAVGPLRMCRHGRGMPLYIGIAS